MSGPDSLTGLLDECERNGWDLKTSTERSGSKRQYTIFVLDYDRNVVRRARAGRMGDAVHRLAAVSPKGSSS